MQSVPFLGLLIRPFSSCTRSGMPRCLSATTKSLTSLLVALVMIQCIRNADVVTTNYSRTIISVVATHAVRQRARRIWNSVSTRPPFIFNLSR